MSGVLLHDGRRSGHHGWCTDAIIHDVADGVFLSPFCTPRISAPRSPSGEEMARLVRGVSGEVIFDVMTHARLLPNTNRVDHYDTWELWGPAGLGLDTPNRSLQHIERVFAHQQALRAPYLAPTVTLEMPQSPISDHAIATAEIARGLQRDCWQSLAGTRSFWRAGPRLDAYVGRLAALRAPGWVITVINEFVADHIPTLDDTAAFAGLCRTIHSLSERSRVIIAHADLAGLISVASGADTIGSGWDRGMRIFDPGTFHVSSDDSPRIPASYVTQGRLLAVLRRDTADAIERWNSDLAMTIRGGPMPPSDQVERVHHLQVIREAVQAINGQGNRRMRIQELHTRYANAGQLFDILIGSLPGVVLRSDKKAWRNNQAAALQAYATSEQLW